MRCCMHSTSLNLSPRKARSRKSWCWPRGFSVAQPPDMAPSPSLLLGLSSSLVVAGYDAHAYIQSSRGVQHKEPMVSDNVIIAFIMIMFLMLFAFGARPLPRPDWRTRLHAQHAFRTPCALHNQPRSPRAYRQAVRRYRAGADESCARPAALRPTCAVPYAARRNTGLQILTRPVCRYELGASARCGRCMMRRITSRA